jgi:hypothetical protein
MNHKDHKVHEVKRGFVSFAAFVVRSAEVRESPRVPAGQGSVAGRGVLPTQRFLNVMPMRVPSNPV